MIPLISVIIPTHNRMDLLPHAIESCLNQTYTNVEIIIVDDGSTDGTACLVNEWLANKWMGRNIRLECQMNAGASAARNRGVALATGEYVQFLDSDDWLELDKLECQINLLQKECHQTDAGCYCWGRMGQPNAANIMRIGRRCETIAALIEALISREVHVMQTSAPLWRREFLIRQAGWRTDISLGDDLEYHVRLLCAANGMGFVERELFFVREHEGPRLSDAQRNLDRTLSQIRTRQAICENLKNTGWWTTTVQHNFLQALRSLYSNILSCGTTQHIKEFEAFYAACARQPKHSLFPLGLIYLRRCFGRDFLLKAHRLTGKATSMF